MDPLDDDRKLIEVQQMPQRSEARNRKEDWTGVTSTAQRRRLQNRLNQRARRRRNAQVPTQSVPSGNSSPQANHTITTDGVFAEVEPALLLQLGNSQDAPQMKCFYNKNRRLMYENFAQQAYAEYANGALRLKQLPTLLGLNLFYAMCHNAAKLGVSEAWLACDTISPFCQEGPGLGVMRMNDLGSVSTVPCPDSLFPTQLQLSVAHHPWIDLFPLPRFRDNILFAIQASEDFEDELCMDSVEIGDCAGSDSAFLIVWGEPWDPRGWEIGPTLLRKWAWLLEGCDEMLKATNYWRERRSEKRIVF